MRLREAAKKVEDSVEETLNLHIDFPLQHWTRIRTNNVIERHEPGDPPPYDE